MSHFAKIENGIVTDVVVATQAQINTEGYGDAFLWVQTSYNCNFRGAYASIGGSYNTAKDIFIPVKPEFAAEFDSWAFNEDTYTWEAPTARPDESKIYNWNEDQLAWDEVSE